MVLGHPLFKLVLSGFIFAFCYHFIAGLRHLIWDMGRFMERSQSQKSAWAVCGSASRWRSTARGGLRGLLCPAGRPMSRHREGVHHWWIQRVTSVALIPLSVWFLVSLISLPSHDYTTVVTWLGMKWTAVLLAIFIAVAAWHSQLGMQIVLEDYARGGMRRIAITLSRLAHTFVAVAAILAVLRMGFGSFA